MRATITSILGIFAAMSLSFTVPAQVEKGEGKPADQSTLDSLHCMQNQMVKYKYAEPVRQEISRYLPPHTKWVPTPPTQLSMYVVVIAVKVGVLRAQGHPIR